MLLCGSLWVIVGGNYIESEIDLSLPGQFLSNLMEKMSS